MTHDPRPWATTLPSLLDEVWSRLARGVHDRRAAARHPTLATVSQSGAPQARTVVLRDADRSGACLRIYTDLYSAKVAELRARPQAALHVWDRGAHLQMRFSASVTILTGAEVANLWAQLPQGARLSYGGAPRTGQPLSDALAYQKSPDQAAFAVLHLDLQEMDILHLRSQHRRARFARTHGWAGMWCTP
ncbi:MAG: pyridoxamine 5'-phosphate oxidase [Rhodobacteraceae bacterium]|nr:MAG: pyridoxamine 5'-phosphate oxidase [Paracoccaceae bacterium]